MSACIIPVAPEFQDPPDPPPSVPYFTPNPTPDFGSSLNITSTIPGMLADQKFAVQVNDSDPTVPLNYKWVFNYPPYQTTTPQTFGLGQTSSGTMLTIDLSCQFLPQSGANSPVTFELIVTDRTFAGTSNLTAIVDDPPGGHVIVASWFVQIPCPAGT